MIFFFCSSIYMYLGFIFLKKFDIRVFVDGIKLKVLCWGDYFGLFGGF